MKAIETHYKGYRFRSRLEARWAVFFDTLSVEWEYEKEGYDLGEAGWYLPDFWLPQLDCFVEIKAGVSNDWSEADRAKATALARQSGKFVFMFGSHLGPCEFSRESDHVVGSGWYFAPSGNYDGCMSFSQCYECGSVRIGHLGGPGVAYTKEDSLLPFCPHEGDWPGAKRVMPDCAPPVMRAYAAARGARFEHGETPNYAQLT